MSAPTRPALRYHGGKWRISSWVIAQLPAHRIYVEPFGGAASVLLRKAKSYAEVYNDLDHDVVNLFSVLRDPLLAPLLRRACELTPFARREFDLAYLATDDPVERARRLLIRSFMGHGSSGVRLHKTGFCSGVFRSHTTPARDWAGWPAVIPAFVERLRDVVIECRPAPQVIARYDSDETLIYVDPPYLFGVRSQKRKGNDLYHGYRHELSDREHEGLLHQLDRVRGMVVLSGYGSDLYDACLRGWRRLERSARADGSRKRTEVIWLNPACGDALGRKACADIAAGVAA